VHVRDFPASRAILDSLLSLDKKKKKKKGKRRSGKTTIEGVGVVSLRRRRDLACVYTARSKWFMASAEEAETANAQAQSRRVPGFSSRQLNDAAYADATQATRLAPMDIHTHLNRGRALTAAGRVDDAVHMYRSVLATVPNSNFHVRKALAIVYFKHMQVFWLADQTLNGVTSEDLAAASTQEVIEFWHMRTRLAYGLAFFLQVRTFAAECVRLDPDAARCYTLAAQAAKSDAAYVEAIAWFAPAQRLENPVYQADLHLRYGQMHARFGFHQAAQLELKKCVQLALLSDSMKTDQLNCKLELAGVSYARGEYKQALAWAWSILNTPGMSATTNVLGIKTGVLIDAIVFQCSQVHASVSATTHSFDLMLPTRIRDRHHGSKTRPTYPEMASADAPHQCPLERDTPVFFSDDELDADDGYAGRTILSAAAALLPLFQINGAGFYENHRALSAFALAALQIAQEVSRFAENRAHVCAGEESTTGKSCTGLLIANDDGDVDAAAAAAAADDDDSGILATDDVLREHDSFAALSHRNCTSIALQWRHMAAPTDMALTTKNNVISTPILKFQTTSNRYAAYAEAAWSLIRRARVNATGISTFHDLNDDDAVVDTRVDLSTADKMREGASIGAEPPSAYVLATMSDAVRNRRPLTNDEPVIDGKHTALYAEMEALLIERGSDIRMLTAVQSLLRNSPPAGDGASYQHAASMNGTFISVELMAHVPERSNMHIRTPSCDERDDWFRRECDAQWNAAMDYRTEYERLKAAAKSTDGGALSPSSRGVIARVRRRALTHIMALGFFWYQWMPLSRGTAGVGWSVTMGLLSSFDLKLRSSMPKHMQPDLEAIFCTSFACYKASKFAAWFRDNVVARDDDDDDDVINWSTLRRVGQTFVTYRDQTAILNTIENSAPMPKTWSSTPVFPDSASDPAIKALLRDSLADVAPKVASMPPQAHAPAKKRRRRRQSGVKTRKRSRKAMKRKKSRGGGRKTRRVKRRRGKQTKKRKVKRKKARRGALKKVMKKKKTKKTKRRVTRKASKMKLKRKRRT
jgi:tetratricopeptide (TPR) repeat protein